MQKISRRGGWHRIGAQAGIVLRHERAIVWRGSGPAHSAGRPARRYIEKATGKLQKTRFPARHPTVRKRVFSF